MKKFIPIVCVLSLFTTLTSSAFAEEVAPTKELLSATPKVTISVAEGYTVLFKDGGVAPGSATTRIGVGLGWRLPKNFTVSMTVGIAVSNADFKPAPRIIVSAGYIIDDRWSFSAGLLYQVNPGYGDTSTTNLLGVSVGPTIKLGGGVALGIQIGVAQCIEGGPISMVLQPGISYTF